MKRAQIMWGEMINTRVSTTMQVLEQLVSLKMIGGLSQFVRHHLAFLRAAEIETLMRKRHLRVGSFAISESQLCLRHIMRC